ESRNTRDPVPGNASVFRPHDRPDARGTGLRERRSPWKAGPVDFAQALTADSLWGWPVEVLDRLLELRTRAWQGEISLDEWREQDAALRGGLPAVNMDEARRSQKDWTDEWVPASRANASSEAGRQLTGRLTALANPAPSDDELWDELFTRPRPV